MSLVKQLAGQTIIYGVGNLLPRIVHYIVFSSYLTYRLNDAPADYAVYLDLYAYASVLIVLFSYRMDTALFRFGQKKVGLERAYSSAFYPMVLTSIGFIMLAYYFSEAIATALTYPGKEYYIKWFAWIIGLDALVLLPMARLRLENKARIFVLYKVANVLITIVLVLFFLEFMPRFTPDIQGRYFNYIESAVDFVFLSNLIASVIIFVGLMIYLVPKRKSIDFALWRKMTWYALPLIVVGVAGSINQYFGVPLQKYLLGDTFDANKAEAGIYGAVQKIPALLAMFTTAYNYAAEPFFFRNADKKENLRLYGDIALFFIVVAGGVVLAIFLGIDLISHLIGSNYRQGLYLIPILLMAYLFLGIYYNVSIWYKLGDKTYYGALIAMTGSVITFVGSFLFLPSEGVIASAWVALVCYVVMVLLAYITGRRHYPINYPVKSMTRQIVIIAGFLLLGLYLRGNQIFYNLALGGIIMVAYIGVSVRLEGARLKQYL